jgi:hypothetical protein
MDPPVATDPASLTFSGEQRRTHRSRWLGVRAVAGIVIIVISFADGWIAHDRELRGEGYRFAHDESPSGVDLRFVKVVDTCLDGARATDLETGIWTREP